MTSTHTRPFRGQAAPWRPTGQPGPADPECGGPFRLLYVCTGNMCRSVFAEVITRHALQERSARRAAWFHVSSAGTAASPGQAVHPYTVAALRRMGIQLDGYEARRLTPSLLRDSDLVLTATVAQRDWAVGLLPAGSRRTFAIREFARVCDTLAGTPGRDEPPLDAPPNPAEQARRVVSAAATRRGQVPFVEPAEDDIQDPRLRQRAFRLCAQDIALTVRACVHALCTTH